MEVGKNKRRITKIVFNWFASSENGEEYTVRQLFEVYDGNQVLEISEHAACGEGDKYFYDVHYYDKKIERIFNPNTVLYDSP